MAKRKLHGAALAAYNRKRGISSGGSKKAITRYKTNTVVKYRKAPAPKKKHRPRSGGGGGGTSGAIRELKSMAPELMASGAYGYATQAPAVDAKGEKTMAGQAREILEKIPTWDQIGKPASHGLFFIFAPAVFGIGGKPRRIAGLLAKAALHKAAGNLGATAFDLEAAAKLGDDEMGDVHLSGDISDADVVE